MQSTQSHLHIQYTQHTQTQRRHAIHLARNQSLKEAADILEAYCSPQSPYPRSGEVLYRLSRVYRRGLGRPENAKLEIKFLREAAVEGYAKAQRIYGIA